MNIYSNNFMDYWLTLFDTRGDYCELEFKISNKKVSCCYLIFMIQRNSKKYFNNIQYVEIFLIFIILEIWERRTKLKQKVNQKKRKKQRYDMYVLKIIRAIELWKGGPKKFCSLWFKLGLTTGIFINCHTPKWSHFATYCPNFDPYFPNFAPYWGAQGPPGPFLRCAYAWG